MTIYGPRSSSDKKTEVDLAGYATKGYVDRATGSTVVVGHGAGVDYCRVNELIRLGGDLIEF